MRILYLVLCSVIFLQTSSAYAQHTTDEAYEVIMQRLEKQQEERKKTAEEARKKQLAPKPQAQDPRNPKDPDASKDPRSNSPSQAYPTLKRADNTLENAKVCELDAISDCMTTLNQGINVCTISAKNCGQNNYGAEDPSCKVYSCDIEKAACMQKAYAAYSGCLSQGKHPQTNSTLSP